MHVVLTHETSQSTRDGGVQSLLDLLRFVDLEWKKYAFSSARTMKELRVPPSIQYLILGGREYRIGGPRSVWFKKIDRPIKGYDPNLFYVTEALDHEGHPHQLDFDLSRGSAFDDELVRVRPIVPRIGRSFSSKGPLVRE